MTNTMTPAEIHAIATDDTPVVRRNTNARNLIIAGFIAVSATVFVGLAQMSPDPVAPRNQDSAQTVVPVASVCSDALRARYAYALSTAQRVDPNMQGGLSISGNGAAWSAVVTFNDPSYPQLAQSVTLNCTVTADGTARLSR